MRLTSLLRWLLRVARGRTVTVPAPQQHPAATPPLDVRPAASAAFVSIVDGTGEGVDRLVGPMLVATGLDARPATTVPTEGPVLLIMPISSDRSPHPTARRLLVELEEPPPTPELGRSAIVVAWFVDDEARVALATPHDPSGRRPVRNAAAELLGSAWQREQNAHGGRQGDAVRCRTSKVRALLDAPNAQAVGDARPEALHQAVHRRDPGFLEALCVRIPDPSQRRDAPVSWSGLDGVVAAVRERLTPR